MEGKISQTNYEFDAEKIMNMSRKEVISTLGPENASKVTEGLKNGTLTYSEFQKICQDSYPVPQQAKLVRNTIFNHLSKSEGFNMFESNKEKQQIYAHMAQLQDKAQNGELSKEDLRELCDNVYGKNSDLSNYMQSEFAKTGKIKEENHTEKFSVQQSSKEEKKTWELEPEEKLNIQKQTAEIAKNHKEQMQQTDNQSMQQISTQQQPQMDMGGMEM